MKHYLERHDLLKLIHEETEIYKGLCLLKKFNDVLGICDLPIISVLKKLRWKNSEFEANLGTES